MAASPMGGAERQPELQRLPLQTGALRLGQDRRVEGPQISEPLLLHQSISIYEVREEGGAIPIEFLGHREEFPAPRPRAILDRHRAKHCWQDALYSPSSKDGEFASLFYEELC